MARNDAPTRAERPPEEGRALPVAAMVESIIGCKWSVRLLQLRAQGQTRPSGFLRCCPGLSAKVMNERWREMVRFGIVRRTVFGDEPRVEVEYRLTPFGRRFMRILDEVGRLQQAIEDGELAEGETAEKPRRSRSRGSEVTVHPRSRRARRR